ncbi:beta strand repeat-containing protein [Marinospirillum perlucidum]|uniref:beta strand repeat-containing protein n=1 Tax=Marinospirillum perlucidum TaxID=1982602 RepID=UPI000DF28E56|nr:filamentous hemagglutinin N-terminal domain-containing protein [Marinospirillum perlucidum]
MKKRAAKSGSTSPIISELHRLAPTALATALLALGGTPLHAAPTGGKITGGQGSINQSGSTTEIHQNSSRLAVEWGSFNVAENERVHFNQPSSSSFVYNQILDANASVVRGQIQANGNVILVNPNGLYFTETATLSVGSLIASGHQLSVDDFMQGYLEFERQEGTSGRVVNRGSIHAATGGSITLLGSSVENSGQIVAQAGRINLAVGERIAVDFDGDGLMRFSVDQELLDNIDGLEEALTNSGELSAQGGSIHLEGRVAQEIFSRVVNNEGIVRAGRIDNSGGEIRLVGSGGSDSSIINTGQVDASAQDEASQGGQITLEALDSTLLISDQSQLDASSSSQSGGQIHLLGQNIALSGSTQVDVSGASGGGEILVGGDYQGLNPDIANADKVIVTSGVQLNADATDQGDGGRIITWADDWTRFSGSLTARGGDQGGDGGFAEVSGKMNLAYSGSADLRAPEGKTGTLLLDPRDINIVATIPDPLPADGQDTTSTNIDFITDAGKDYYILNSTINSQTADVILQATNNITQDAAAAINITNAGTGITLQAGNNINIQGGITTNGGHIHLEAHSPATTQGTTGSLTVGSAGDANSGLSSNGGSITLIAKDFTFNQGMNAGTGNINVANTSGGLAISEGITSSANIAQFTTSGILTLGEATTAGNSTLKASSISLANNVIYAPNNAGINTIKISSDGNLSLGNSSSINTNASNLILDISGDITRANTNTGSIKGNSVVLDVGGSLGTSGRSLLTETNNLVINSGNQGWVDNKANTTSDTTTLAGSVTNGLTLVQSQGHLNVGELTLAGTTYTGLTHTGTNPVSLSTTGVDTDITVSKSLVANGNITLNATRNISSVSGGNVTSTGAGNSISLSGNTLSLDSDLTASDGNILLTATDALNLNSGTVTANAAGRFINLTANSIAQAAAHGGLVSKGLRLNSAATGDLNLHSNANLIETLAANITGTGSNLSLKNNQALSIGTVDSLAGITTDSGNLVLGVNGVLTTNANITNSNSGSNIHLKASSFSLLTGEISTTNGGLRMEAMSNTDGSGAINQDGGHGGITASSLLIILAGNGTNRSVNLGSSGNSIGRLAGRHEEDSTNSIGDFNLKNNAELTVDTLDAGGTLGNINGLIANNITIGITGDGNHLNVAQALDAGTGDLKLSTATNANITGTGLLSGNNVIVEAGAAIGTGTSNRLTLDATNLTLVAGGGNVWAASQTSATTLAGTATGSFDLTQAGGALTIGATSRLDASTLNGVSATGITLAVTGDANHLTVNQVVNAGTGDLKLSTATNANITGTGLLSGNNVIVEAGAAIGTDTSNRLTLDATNLTLVAGGGNVWAASQTSATTLAGTATGTFDLTQAGGALTVGSGADSSGTAVDGINATGITLAVTGDANHLAINQAVNAGTGDLKLSTATNANITGTGLLSGNNVIVEAGAAIGTDTSNRLTLDATNLTLVAGGGNVWAASQTSATTLAGTATGTFDLTQAGGALTIGATSRLDASTLNGVSATGITLAVSGDGNHLNVNQALNANAGDLKLSTGANGNITSTSTGSLSGRGIYLNATGSIGASGSRITTHTNNLIVTSDNEAWIDSSATSSTDTTLVAGSATNGFDLSQSLGHLSVGSVAAGGTTVAGITGSSTISLATTEAARNLTVSEAITSTGTINLTATSNMTGAGLLTGDSVIAEAGTDLGSSSQRLMTAAGNVYISAGGDTWIDSTKASTTLAGDITGALDLLHKGDLSVGTVNSIAGLTVNSATLDINAGTANGHLNINENLSVATSLSLNSEGTLTTAAIKTLELTGTGTLAITAASLTNSGAIQANAANAQINITAPAITLNTGSSLSTNGTDGQITFNLGAASATLGGTDAVTNYLIADELALITTDRVNFSTDKAASNNLVIESLAATNFSHLNLDAYQVTGAGVITSLDQLTVNTAQLIDLTGANNIALVSLTNTGMAADSTITYTSTAASLNVTASTASSSVATGNNAIRIDATSGVLTVSDTGITAASGNIELRSDLQITTTVAGTINAGTNRVILATSDVTKAIHLGGTATAGRLDIADDLTGKITTGTLQIGRSGMSGTIQVEGAFSRTGDLALNVGTGSILNAAGTSRLAATGSLTLNADTIGSSTESLRIKAGSLSGTASGSLYINHAGNLTLGGGGASLSAGDGKTLSVTTVTDSDEGNLILGDAVSVGGTGTLILNAAGSITSTAADDIASANTIQLSAGTDLGTSTQRLMVKANQLNLSGTDGKNAWLGTERLSGTDPVTLTANMNGSSLDILHKDSDLQVNTLADAATLNLENNNSLILATDITTTGNQTYQGVVTLANGDRTLTTTNSNISFASTMDGSQTLTLAAGTGTASFTGHVGGTTNLNSLDVTAGSISLGGNVTTTGTQTYNGTLTLAGANGSTQTLTATTVSFDGSLNGTTASEQSLIISGAASFTGDLGATTGLGSLEITGASTLAGTAGKTHHLKAGTVTLGGGVNASSAGQQSLLITGNAVLSDNLGSTTQLDSLEITGTASLAGNITTQGSQTYTGQVTLAGTAAGTRILTADAGQLISMTGGLTGDGRSLEVNQANWSLGSSGASGLLNLNVDGTTSLYASSVTTSGYQTYADTLTLHASGDTSLASGDNQNLSFAAISTADTTQRNLLLATGTSGTSSSWADISFSGQLTGLTDLTVQHANNVDFNATGTTTLAGALTQSTGSGSTSFQGDLTADTLSLQTGTVVLADNKTLTVTDGKTLEVYADNLTFGAASELNAGSGQVTLAPLTTTNSLLVCSSASSSCTGIFDSVYDLGSLAVTASSIQIGRSTHEGNISLKTLSTSFDVTLENAATHQISVLGNYTGQNLTLNSNGGSISLGADITTTGNQTYSGAVVLNSAAQLTAENNSSVLQTITFNGTLNSQATQAYGLTLIGNTSFNDQVGAATDGALGALAINSSGSLTLADGFSIQAASLSATGTTSLGGNITTSGDQTYTGAITLTGSSATRTLTAGAGQLITATGGITGGSNSLVIQTADFQLDSTASGLNSFTTAGTATLNADLTSTGAQSYQNLVLNAALSGSSVSVAGTTSLGGNVTTSGDQTYTGAITLTGTSATRTLTAGAGQLITATGGITGGSNSLVIQTADFQLDSTASGLNSFTAAGTATLNADLTSTGAQSYQNLVLNAALSGSSLSVAGTTSLGGNVTTSGDQTYTGAITLTGTSATRTLTAGAGQLITATGGITGGSNSLVIQTADFQLDSTASGLNSFTAAGTATLNADLTSTGAQSYQNLVLNAALSGSSLSVAGTTSLGGNVTTSGDQTYTGAITLTGSSATRTLTAGAGQLITATGGITGGGNSLVIQNADFQLDSTTSGLNTFTAAGTATLNADLTSNGAQSYQNLVLNAALSGSSLSVAGTTSLGGNVTTSGDQTYTGAITLTGTSATRTLTAGAGQLVTVSGGITGGSNSLVIQTANFQLGSAASGLNSFTTAGTATLNADLTSTGAQSYQNLVLNAALSASSLSVAGTTSLGGDVTTSGDQTYTGAITLTGSSATRTLTADASQLITATGGITGGGNSLVIQNADFQLDSTASGLNSFTTAGTATLNADLTSTGAQSYQNLVLNAALSGSSLSVAGTTSLGGNVTTSGSQTYSGAVTLTSDLQLKTTNNNITFESTLDGAYFLTLDAGTAAVAFQGNVGASTPLTGLDITAGTVNLTTSLALNGSLALTGDLTLTGNTQINTNNNSLTLGSAVSGQGYSLELLAGTGDISLQAASNLSALTLTSANNINLNGNLQINSGGAFEITSASGLTQLAGSTQITAETIRINSASLQFGHQSSLDASAVDSGSIYLYTDTFTALGDLTVSAGSVSGVASLSSQNTSATLLVCLTGDCDTTGLTSPAVYTLTSSITVDASQVHIGSQETGKEHQGNIILRNLTLPFDLEVTTQGSGKTLTVDGGYDSSSGSGSNTGALTLNTASDGQIVVAGDITTHKDLILANAVQINQTASLKSNQGKIHFQSTVDGQTAGSQSLSLQASNGNILLDGALGSTQSLAGLTLVSAVDSQLNSISVTGALTQQAGTGTTTFSGSLSAGSISLDVSSLALNGINLDTSASNGNISLSIDEGLDTGTGTTIDAGTGSVQLSSSNTANTLEICSDTSCLAAGTHDTQYDLGDLSITAGNILFGRSSHTGNIYIQELAFDYALGVNTTGNIYVQGALDGTINSSGSLSLNAGSSGNIYLQGNITTSGSQNYQSLVQLTGGNYTLTTSNQAITFANAIQGNSNNLTLNTGAGNLSLQAASLNDLTLSNAGNASFNGTLSLSGAFVQNAGSGNTHFLETATASSFEINATTITLDSGKSLSTSATNGDIQLFTDNLAISGLLDAGTGGITLAPLVDSRELFVCSGSCTTDSNYDSSDPNHALYNIGGDFSYTAGSFAIGKPSQTGDITLYQFEPAFDLSLATTGSINISGQFTSDHSLSLDGGTSINISHDITTKGDQYYKGAVVLMDPDSSTSTAGISLTSSSGSITFDATLDSGTDSISGIDSGNSFGLTLDAATEVVFNNAVSANASLAKLNYLNVTSSSPIKINADIETLQQQSYSGQVTLTGNRQLTAGSGQLISMNAGLNGGSANLTISNANWSLGSAGATDLGNLNIDTGISTLSGNITTSGTQNYQGGITLNQDAQLSTTNSAITFGGSISGSYALTLDSGTATQVLDQSINLQSLTVNSDTTTLSTDVTTTGAQTYQGAVTLSGIRNLSASQTTFANTLTGDDSNLTLSGNAVLSGAVTNIQNLTVTGSSSLSADITTSGTQDFQGAVTLTGSRNLTATQTTFGSTLSGDGSDLTLTGNAVLSGAVTNIQNLTVTGTSSLNANVTTTGTQDYQGAATLTGTRSLSASQTTFDSTLTGDGNDLTLTGNAVLNAAVTNIQNLTVTGTSSLNADVTTSGSQDYQGAATLTGARNLSGTQTTFSSTLSGDGSNLTLNGNAVLSGAVSSIQNLTVTGTSSLNAEVTTSGTQEYQGAVALTGSRNLTATQTTFASTLTGDGSDLTLTGNAVLNGAVSSIHNLTITGTSSLNANVTTSGTQDYQGAATLTGTRNLSATQTTFGSTLTSDGSNLTLTGNAVLNGAVSSIQNLTITGTSSLNANVTTSGTQNYQGAATLTATRNLTATQTTFNSTLTGDGNDLTLTSNAVLQGAVSNIQNLTVTGTSNLSANVTTTGTQDYQSAAILNGSLTLQAGQIDFNSTLNGNGYQLTLNSGSGDITALASWSQISNLTITQARNVSLKDTTLTGTFRQNSGSGNLQVDGTLQAQYIDVSSSAAELTASSQVVATGSDTSSQKAIEAYIDSLTLGTASELRTDNGSFLLAPYTSSNSFAVSQGSWTGHGADLHYDLNNLNISTQSLILGHSGQAGKLHLNSLNASYDLTFASAGGIELYGNITTLNYDQSYQNQVNINSNLTLNLGSSGDLTFSDALTGNADLTLQQARNVQLQTVNLNGLFQLNQATATTQVSSNMTANSIELNSAALTFASGVTLDTSTTNGNIELFTDSFTAQGQLTVNAGSGRAQLAAQDTSKDIYVCMTDCPSDASKVVYQLNQKIQVTAAQVRIGSQEAGSRHQGAIYLQRLPFTFDLEVTTDGSIQVDAFNGSLDLNGLTLDGESILLQGDGDDQLTGYSTTANQWILNSSNSGTLNNTNFTITGSGSANTASFSGFTQLVGGDVDDSFTLTATGRIGSQIQGGTGRNTLDISATNTALTLEVGKDFTGIQQVTGQGDNLKGSSSNANAWSLNSANAGTLTTGSETISFSGMNQLVSGTADNTFTSTGVYTGNILLETNNSSWDYTAGKALTLGKVLGTGSLTIAAPASGTGSTLSLSASDLVLTGFTEHTGTLFIGGRVTPANLPLNSSTSVTVNTNRLVIDDEVNVSSHLVFLAADIEINTDTITSTQGSASFLATGSLCNGCEASLTGEGNLKINTPTTVTATEGRVIAAGGIINSEDLRLDFNGGDFELAVSANQQETSQPNQASNAQGVTLSAATQAFIQALDLELVSVSVSFTNPAAAVLGVRAIEVIDLALFEEDLTLFGRLGEGVALDFAQCEEVEGCTPNVTVEELNASISQLDLRIQQLEAELDATEDPERRKQIQELLTQYQAQKEEFLAYREDLQDFTGFEEQLANELGGEDEIDMEAIEREVKIIETIYTRVQFLESLQFNEERRAEFAQRTGMDLTEERLEAIIESTMKAAQRTEAIIERMLDGE